LREERRYRCGGCGKEGPWGPGWRWPNVPIDRGYYDRRVGQPACGDGCEARILAGDLA
jgi:hypothetical protein